MKRGVVKAYFYAIRVSFPNSKYGRYLVRKNASAPSLFWFHEDAVKAKKECDSGQDDENRKTDIIKVFVRWNNDGKTYNEPGDMFRSKRELRRHKEGRVKL